MLWLDMIFFPIFWSRRSPSRFGLSLIWFIFVHCLGEKSQWATNAAWHTWGQQNTVYAEYSLHTEWQNKKLTDVIAYNATIVAVGKGANPLKALNLLEEMKKWTADGWRTTTCCPERDKVRGLTSKLRHCTATERSLHELSNFVALC